MAKSNSTLLLFCLKVVALGSWHHKRSSTAWCWNVACTHRRNHRFVWWRRSHGSHLKGWAFMDLDGLYQNPKVEVAGKCIPQERNSNLWYCDMLCSLQSSINCHYKFKCLGHWRRRKKFSAYRASWGVQRIEWLSATAPCCLSTFFIILPRCDFEVTPCRRTAARWFQDSAFLKVSPCTQTFW